MKIITLTLNPAIDLHVYTKELKLGDDNPSRLLRRDSGGKGVNLSRALHKYGIESLCYMLVGREDAEDFIRPLRECGMNLLYTAADGFVRENINIHTPESETVIATEGPLVTSEVLDSFGNTLMPLIDEETVVCLTGRIANGMDKSRLLLVLREMSEKGARLVFDSKSLSLDDILPLSPFLIKPNESEARAMLGMDIDSEGLALRAARRLCAMGVRNVIISRGKAGGVYSGELGDYIGRVPSVECISSVGAGDSTLAGFLAALTEGRSYSEPFRLALAFGTAACMEDGTLPPDPCNISRIYDEITIYEM